MGRVKRGDELREGEEFVQRVTVGSDVRIEGGFRG